MNKLIPILFFLAFSLIAKSQLTGDGTYSNPWKGTLAGDQTWNGTKYINGNIIVDNEKLTISPGTIIIFLSRSANLIITGSGQLEAVGTAGNMIRFTADFNNNGVYGETGETWGHISFQNMGNAGPSLINYCIIEYGDVSTAGTADNPYRYGGAVHAAFDDLTISNCIIQNNKAKFGGAVFVNKYFSPTINNCYFFNNKSAHAGGGIYFWVGSESIVTNCIFDSNHCLEPSNERYTGGGICTQNETRIKILNCTFVNNTTTRSAGSSIELFGTLGGDTVQNCIIWGDGVHFFMIGNSHVVQYCAIQGAYPTGTGNFQLDSGNSSVNGPNFKTTDGSDWSINYVSPCRDAGTTPEPELPLDFSGNPRIGPYDIGAFEVQYSRWKTTASSINWNTENNWDGGIPTSARDVIIPAGASYYPVESPGPDFTIGAGKQMIIEAGARATLRSLNNYGIIKLNHSTTDFASLILNSYTRGTGGSEEIQLFLSGGGSELNEDYKWHYISSPVTSLSTNVFTQITKNLAQYIESRPVFSLADGWVAYDGYVYSTGRTDGPTFSALAPGKGYNYFNSTDHTFTFGGSLNTYDVTTSLAYTIGTPQSVHGFNLLGNPFSSGLNWDDIIEGVYYPYPDNTSKGLYFTRDNKQCSYIAGVGIPSDVTGIIPPMQGFFNKTSSAGKSIILPAAARTHDNIHSRYKGSGIIPLVRLAILEDDVSNDETVVRFSELAKTGLDNDYDALKMFLSSKKTTIHTSLGGVDYAINGQPFPESILEIPVVVNVTSTKTHKIASTQLQGLDGYDLYLTDKSTGFTANLKTNPVLTFSAEPGLFKDRFILKIDISTGIGDIYTSANSFNIYQSFGNINIQTLEDAWDGKTGSVKIMDMSGKIVTDLRNAGFSKNSVTEVQAPASGGLYFIEISSGMNRYVGKVMIK
ncbi:MAG TPA: T9SS type A sorting domain-containing protein [Bacteroidales bacterium]|nr:T9SS type A sorting domain-containing protein [Bacteroidales bacterium]